MVSVIILSWNAQDLIQSCIDSVLLASENLAVEIIVVDNGSSDGSAELLQKLYSQNSKIKLILNKTNLGYAGGNNQAWDTAQGDYVLLLNQDTIVPKNLITTLHTWLEQHSQYGAATAALRFPDGRLQYYMHRRFPTFFSLCGALLHKRWPSFAPTAVRHYLYLDKTFQEDFDIEQAAGTCILLRRTAIQQLGHLFDVAHFPLYYNDVDLCYRLHQADWKIRCLTTTAVLHHKGTSVRKVPRLRNSWIYLKAVWYYGFVLGRFFTTSAAEK